MRILVTGAGGMLGRRVVAAAGERGHETVAAGHADLDVTDAQAVFDFVADAAPDAIVHCAAYTDVDGAEADEARATVVNADAAAHVAAAGGRNGAFVVCLSTDYVFAGDAERPYVESDAPAPRSAYGRSKLAGEHAVQDLGGDAAIVRTAWLFGAGGRNFVDTILRLARERDTLSVVADQVGSPTWTGHLAPALVELCERRSGGVHHLCGAGRCSWFELASAAVRRAGADARVEPASSAEFPRPAPRPAFSVLGTERPDAIVLPGWQEGLAGHLSERDPA